MTSIIDLQRDAAVKRARAESALYESVRRIVLGTRSTAWRYRIGHLVTVQPDYDFAAAVEIGGPTEDLVTQGSYAVEVIERVDKTTERSMWRTACEGVADSWNWHTVDQALLHLIAVRKGQRDDRGDIVTFASRVIGFDDCPPS